MMRTNPSTSMQKTYDECFLTCSTAVYYESQNNETEALRMWKSALDQIYCHNANRSASYRPRSETERVLQDSLKQLELQCKERVDLLEALKKSREEAGENGEKASQPRDAPPMPPPHRTPAPATPSEGSSTWLGGGTVAPVEYNEICRPPLPHRPSLPPRKSSPPRNETSRPVSASRPSHDETLFPAPTRMNERTPSPGKKTRMLRTLRPGVKEGGRSSSSNSRPSSSKLSTSSESRPPVAAKAATLAFGHSPYTNPSRPAYPRHPTSTESLAASRDATSRSSFDDRRPSGANPRHALASSAAARSWSDLGTEKTPAVHKSAALPAYPPAYPPPPPNAKLQRNTKHVAPLRNVALEVSAEPDGTQQTPKRRSRQKEATRRDDPPSTSTSDVGESEESEREPDEWKDRVRGILKNLPRGVDEAAAQQILNEIVIHGDEVHWEDIAGLDVAKSALKENVVYPFLRPDLFMGLREPARGMLLFGPPGTGKTMLARAVATESRSTFFAISASSLTSKFLGESEKLVRALFVLAKMLAPSIIFVDEIDSLLSARSSSGEHEASRRIKTEFLIQWSDLAKAAAGREQSDEEKKKGDATRVLVLAATNLPWAIDEAARRRFVRRQYIPLPEGHVRKVQLKTLLSHQKHELGEEDMDRLVTLTEGFSGSDITSLAKDAAMGPLRSLGEKLLHMTMDEIRPIRFEDFQASLTTIRPSVSKQGLKAYEDWAIEFGERGG